jgi:hypothetical protein
MILKFCALFAGVALIREGWDLKRVNFTIEVQSGCLQNLIFMSVYSPEGFYCHFDHEQSACVSTRYLNGKSISSPKV